MTFMAVTSVAAGAGHGGTNTATRGDSQTLYPYPYPVLLDTEHSCCHKMLTVGGEGLSNCNKENLSKGR